MRSRQYYESLSTAQLIEAAKDAAREGRPQPELLAVLADVLDETDAEVFTMQLEIDSLNDRITELTTALNERDT